MKSTFKAIKIKSIIYNIIFLAITITISVIIICLILYLIIPIFNKNEIIPVNIFVFNNELSFKIQEEINNAISLNIENIYNRLLSSVQFSIALFSASLLIFAIVFGVIYFSKIRDAETLIKEIQKTPDLFFKQFYREQYNKNISNLFSLNNITRNNAIINLTYNPEIKIGDYDILREVFLNELDSKTNIYFHQNTSTIINILMKIDYPDTISLLIKILTEHEYDIFKHNSILSYIAADNSVETNSFIKDNLLKENQMSTQLISLLSTNGLLNNYLDYIMINCSGTTLQMVLSMLNSDIWKINTDNIINNIYNRKDIDTQNLQYIISINKFSTKEIISIVLNFYIKDTDKFEDSLTYLISHISNDDNSKKEFLSFSSVTGYAELLQKYFDKNDHMKSFFTNFQDNIIVKPNSEDKSKKTKLDIIKQKGLYLSDDKLSVIDKEGNNYSIEQYSNSMFGLMVPVQTGIMVDGTYINIEDLKS